MVIYSKQLIKKGIMPEKGSMTLYWEVWESYVHERTKHWGECNRCAELFDHHCKWLNNCIGAKNYKTFMILIIFVGIAAIVYIFWGLIFITISFMDSDPEDVGFWIADSDGNSGIRVLMAIIVVILVIISGVILTGIILLLKLHFKLMKYDFTTYEYVQYMSDRRDLEFKLKNKKITKEKFKELDAKARDKKFKKRSKIIKEVNEVNEQKILDKLMRKNNINQDNLEESKIADNSKVKIKVTLMLKIRMPPLRIKISIQPQMRRMQYQITKLWRISLLIERLRRSLFTMQA
jgi:hypothetical protein